MDATHLPTIDDALQALQRRSATPRSLAEDCYRRIHSLDPSLKAFITVVPLQDALGSQVPPDGNPHSDLIPGIPVAVKDLFDTAGIRTTVGSRFFETRVPQEDAWVVTRLREAGGILVGKTNTHEIALGVTGDNPHYGTARNPWDRSRIPGGSSSGSAIAVATGMAFAALGSDTGGSIRLPASLCGVVGLKPTLGRVSTRGVFPLSWNLDHVGPLTRSVRDAARVLQVIAGYDEADPASIRMPVGDYLQDLAMELRGQRIALGVGEHIGTSEREVQEAVAEAARVFETLGCSVREVNVDWMRGAALANRLMTQSDGAAVHADRLAREPERFGDDVRRRLEAGARTTSTEYILARRTQAEVRRTCDRLFETADLLLLPTTPMPAPVIAGYDAVERAGQLTPFTAPFNLTGLPALSVPCGFTTGGLPIGLQIVGKGWEEGRVLAAGHAFEQRTDWHTRTPDI